MANVPNSKSASTEALLKSDLSGSSSDASGASNSVWTRYYFNLTDGETMIRDEEGIEASGIQAAVVSALEAAEELRAQDPSTSDEWQGWRLEIVDTSGRAVQTIPLDARSTH